MVASCWSFRGYCGPSGSGESWFEPRRGNIDPAVKPGMPVAKREGRHRRGKPVENGVSALASVGEPFREHRFGVGGWHGLKDRPCREGRDVLRDQVRDAMADANRESMQCRSTATTCTFPCRRATKHPLGGARAIDSERHLGVLSRLSLQQG
jgi:hypothetical protein